MAFSVPIQDHIKEFEELLEGYSSVRIQTVFRHMPHHQNCQFPRVSHIAHSMCTRSGQVCEMNCVQVTVHSSFHKLVHWLYTCSAQYWTLLGTVSFGDVCTVIHKIIIVLDQQ